MSQIEIAPAAVCGLGSAGEDAVSQTAREGGVVTTGLTYTVAETSPKAGVPLPSAVKYHPIEAAEVEMGGRQKPRLVAEVMEGANLIEFQTALEQQWGRVGAPGASQALFHEGRVLAAVMPFLMAIMSAAGGTGNGLLYSLLQWIFARRLAVSLLLAGPECGTSYRGHATEHRNTLWLLAQLLAWVRRGLNIESYWFDDSVDRREAVLTTISAFQRLLTVGPNVQRIHRDLINGLAAAAEGCKADPYPRLHVVTRQELYVPKQLWHEYLRAGTVAAALKGLSAPAKGGLSLPNLPSPADVLSGSLGNVERTAELVIGQEQGNVPAATAKLRDLWSALAFEQAGQTIRSWRVRMISLAGRTPAELLAVYEAVIPALEAFRKDAARLHPDPAGEQRRAAEEAAFADRSLGAGAIIFQPRADAAKQLVHAADVHLKELRERRDRVERQHRVLINCTHQAIGQATEAARALDAECTPGRAVFALRPPCPEGFATPDCYFEALCEQPFPLLVKLLRERLAPGSDEFTASELLEEVRRVAEPFIPPAPGLLAAFRQLHPETEPVDYLREHIVPDSEPRGIVDPYALRRRPGGRISRLIIETDGGSQSAWVRELGRGDALTIDSSDPDRVTLWRLELGVPISAFKEFPRWLRQLDQPGFGDGCGAPAVEDELRSIIAGWLPEEKPHESI